MTDVVVGVVCFALGVLLARLSGRGRRFVYRPPCPLKLRHQNHVHGCGLTMHHMGDCVASCTDPLGAVIVVRGPGGDPVS